MRQSAVEELKQHIGVVAEGLRAEIGEVKAQVGVVAEGLQAEIGEVKAQVGVVAGQLRTEATKGLDDVKRHMGVLAEGLRGDIRLVAEGHESIRNEIGEFRSEVRGEFRDVRSTMSLSYSALDERVTHVERDVISLKDRVGNIASKGR